MTRLLIGFILALILAAPAQAQSAGDYRALSAKAASDPRGADYIALRKAYYAIYSGPATPARTTLAADTDRASKAYAEARKAGNNDAAEQHVQELLKANFGVVAIHLLAAGFYKEARKQPDKAALYAWSADQLMKATTSIGDGNSTKTAFMAISVREEYVIMDYLGYMVTSQALLHEGGRSYDRLTGRPKANPSGREISVYFDITGFFGRY